MSRELTRRTVLSDVASVVATAVLPVAVAPAAPLPECVDWWDEADNAAFLRAWSCVETPWGPIWTACQEGTWEWQDDVEAQSFRAAFERTM